MKIVIDTSALLSLAAGGILDLIVQSLDCVVPERVYTEIKGLSLNNDFEGNLSKNILSYLREEIKVMQTSKYSKEGEIECAYLANELGEVEFLITDDTRSLEKLEKITKKNIRFSTILVYALFIKRKISKKQGLQIIERMRVKRNWKDNIIFEQAKLFWS